MSKGLFYFTKSNSCPKNKIYLQVQNDGFMEFVNNSLYEKIVTFYFMKVNMNIHNILYNMIKDEKYYDFV